MQLKAWRGDTGEPGGPLVYKFCKCSRELLGTLPPQTARVSGAQGLSCLKPGPAPGRQPSQASPGTLSEGTGVVRSLAD